MPDTGVLEPGAGAGADAPQSGAAPFDRRVIVVGGVVFAVLMAYLRQFFASVRAVATLSNPYCVHNQEFDGHVYPCTGPRHPWGQMRPRLRSYS